MAHTFDTKLRFTGSSAPLTANYTCGAGSTVLVLSLVVAGTTPRSGGAPTFNGVAMTQAGTTRGNTTGYETGTELWYLLSPPTGSAYQVSIPNGGTARTIYAVASTYKSATGVSALDVANGNAATSGANPSVSLTTTVNGAAIVATMGNGLTAAPTGRTGISLYETDDGSYSDSGQYLLQATAGTQAMGWTIATDDWCICVVAFREVPLAKSGTAAITGGGTLTATPKKGGKQGGSVTTTTHVLGAICKGALILAAIGILGHVLGTGVKAYPLILSGGGMVAVEATKGVERSISVSAGMAGFAYPTYVDNFATGVPGPIDLETWGSWERKDPPGASGESIYWNGTPEVGRTYGRGTYLWSCYLDKGVPQAKDSRVGFRYLTNSGFTEVRRIYFRYIDQSNYSICQIDGAGSVQFADVVAGDWQTCGVPHAVPTPLWLNNINEIRAVGTTYEYYLNGVLHHTVSGSAARNVAGWSGIGSYGWYDYHGVLTDFAVTIFIPIPNVAGNKGASGNLSLNTFFDDFNRADCNITYGPWTAFWEYPAAIVFNRFTGTQAGYHSAALYTGPGAFPDDQKAEYVLVSPGSGSGGGFGRGVIVRASAQGGLRGYYTVGLGPGTIRIYRLSGSAINIADVTLTLAPGDRIALEAIGASPVTINLYQNDILRATFTDSANTSLTGTPGVVSITTMTTSPTDNFKTWIDRTLKGGGTISAYSPQTEEGSLAITGGGAVAVVGAKDALLPLAIAGNGTVALQGMKGGLSEPSAVVYAQDNFNRADTTVGNIGANWNASLALISGQQVLEGFTGDSHSYWVGAGTFGNDQSSEITWPDVSSGNAVACGPSVRVQSSGSRRYAFRGSVSGLKSYAGIYVYAPSMYSVGGFVDTSWITAGSKVRLKVVGNVLSVYVNGSLWYSATDTNNRVSSGGVPGFDIHHTAARIDDFVSAGDKPTDLRISGGGAITVAGHKGSYVAVTLVGGGTLYASAREEAYRAVSIHGGGAIVLASHKGARSVVPIPGGGTVSVQTRKDALVVVRVSGNGINSGEAITNARGLVWALLRGGGDIAVAFLAEHPGSVAVTGGGSIVVKWVRSWPYRPVTDIGDPDATALLVEIDLEVCTREFGISPCLGTGAPCYKTWGTCKYISAFTPTKRTYRFCSADYPQIFPDARPYLIAVKWLATEIRQNLTVNARVVLDFIDEPDTDVGFDPYWSQRANHPGTFWKKFFARNINYRGRFIRVYEGRPGAAESTYVLRWTGRLDNVTASGSQFSLESVDILKDISKIEVPPKVSAKLAADTAAGYTVSFSITEDADRFPSSGYVRIEDEIIKYESKDDLTKVFSLLSRGQFGTVDSNHPAAEKVQPVRYFEPKSGYDHLLDMLLVDGGIDPVYVDSPAFFFYRDFPQKDIDFTAVVSEPTKLSTLFYEVIDLLDSKAWVSENFKITVRRNVQNQPGRSYYPLDDETSLIDKTVKVDLNEDSRITRVAIFWDLKVVSKSTDQTSYRKIDLAVNPDAETNYDGPIEKKILCRWIDPTIAEEEKVMRYVRNLALRRIVRERDAQTIIHIEVAPKDAGVLTGEFIFLTSNETLAVDGEPLSAIYQVVKRERKKDSYALTLSKVARRKICLIAPSGFPSYASATDAQREYGFVSDIQGKMSDFRYGYFIW